MQSNKNVKTLKEIAILLRNSKTFTETVKNLGGLGNSEASEIREIQENPKGKPKATVKTKSVKRIMTTDSWGNPVIKELAEDEEYVILEDGWYEPEETEGLLEPAPNKPNQFNPDASLILLYARTPDDCIGQSYKGFKETVHLRNPQINHAEYIAKIAQGCVVVMGGNGYRSLLTNGISNIPGVILAVITTDDDLVLDPEVIRFQNMHELEKHIRVAQTVGQKVYINGGPRLLEYFEGSADGAYVLTSGIGRNTKRGIQKLFYKPKQPKSLTKLADSVKIHGISKNPVTLQYLAYK